MSKNDKKREIDYRIDFVIDRKVLNKKTKEFSFHIVPDSRRYKWEKKDGKKYLYDTKDNLLIPEKVVEDMMKQSVGKPIYHQPSIISDVNSYFKNRVDFVERGLRGDIIECEKSDVSGNFLDNIDKENLGFVIMCVDMVGSTKLANNLESIKYTRLITTLLNELSEITFGFRGHILKYTGDGILAYFSEPSLLSKNDLSLDCAMIMTLFIEKLFNPICVKYQYPEINIRIGIDTGQAAVVVIGSPSTKRQSDIIGKVVNIASKIQSIGKPGNILVGEATNRIIHTMWREGLEKIPIPNNWPYMNDDGKPYGVYKLRDGFVPKITP
ncbi:MAG: adenylate/guanylate cyclase domain-containing protein [candidate division Zixibacteria bacterium]|nr:adenylate/guanylate cyclase domain-containing protein [candidate division Zixibacteria bacterium]